MSDDLYSVYGGGDEDYSDSSSGSTFSSPLQTRSFFSSSSPTPSSQSNITPSLTSTSSSSSSTNSTTSTNNISPIVSSFASINSFEEITVEFWENQRFRALQGWSPSFPGSNVRNYTSLNGVVVLEGLDNAGTRGAPSLAILVQELFQAPRGWTWVEPSFLVDTKGAYGTVDAEGWSYSNSIDQLIRLSLDRQLRGEKTSLSMARRRRWIRTLRINKDSEEASELIARESNRKNYLNSILKKIDSNQMLYQNFNKIFSTLPLKISKNAQELLTNIDIFYVDLINSMEFLLNKLKLLQTFLNDHISLEKSNNQKLIEVTNKWCQIHETEPLKNSYSLFSNAKNQFLTKLKTSLQEKMNNSINLEDSKSKVGVFSVMNDAQRKIIENKEKYIKKLEGNYSVSLAKIINQLEGIVDRCNEEGNKLRDSIVYGIELNKNNNQFLMVSFTYLINKLNKLKSEINLTSSTTFLLNHLESDPLPFLSPDLTDFSLTTQNLYTQFIGSSPPVALPSYQLPSLPPSALPAPVGALQLNVLENDLWYKSFNYGQKLVTLGSILVNYETEAKIMKKKILEVSNSSSSLIRKIVKLMIGEHVKIGEELLELLGISDDLGFIHENLSNSSAVEPENKINLSTNEDNSTPIPPFSPTITDVDYNTIYDSSSRFDEAGLTFNEEFNGVSPINKNSKVFFSSNNSTSDQSITMMDSPLLKNKSAPNFSKVPKKEAKNDSSTASEELGNTYGGDDEVISAESPLSTPTTSPAPKRTSIFGNLFGSSPQPAAITPPPAPSSSPSTPSDQSFSMMDSPLLKKRSSVSTNSVNVSLTESFNEVNPLNKPKTGNPTSQTSANSPVPIPSSRNLSDSPLMKSSGRPNALLTRTRSSISMTPNSASLLASTSNTPIPPISTSLGSTSITPRPRVSSTSSTSPTLPLKTEKKDEKATNNMDSLYMNDSFDEEDDEEVENEMKHNEESLLSFLDIKDNFSTTFLPQFSPLFSHISRCSLVSFSLLNEDKIYDNALLVLTFDGYLHLLLTPQSTDFKLRVRERIEEKQGEDDGGVHLLSFLMENYLSQLNCPLSLPISKLIVQSVIDIEKYEENSDSEKDDLDDEADSDTYENKDSNKTSLTFLLSSQNVVFPHAQPSFASSLASYSFPSKWIKGTQIDFTSKSEANKWKKLISNPFADLTLTSPYQ